jgi:alkaline phosphatase D
VKVSDAGRTYNNGNPPDHLIIGEEKIPNLRKNNPPGTILGEKQKEWFKNTLKASEATWKVIGSSVPMMPMRMDLQNIDPNGEEVIFTTDTWEGYLKEREEILNYVKSQGITNFISLSGDNHNSFAGVLSPNFEDETLEIVGAEFSVCGISSTSVFKALSTIVEEEDELRPLVTFGGKHFNREEIEVENLNTTFLWGTRAALTASKTGSIDETRKHINPAHNAHLRYVDSNAYGIGIASFSRDHIRTEFITIPPPVEMERKQPLRKARLEYPAKQSASGRGQDLILTEVEGRKPFPLA